MKAEENNSIQLGSFRLLLEDNGALKVTAVGRSNDTIRIEPKSSNCILIHTK